MSWGSTFLSSLDAPSKSIEYALRFISSTNDYFLGAGSTITTSSLINIGAASVTIDNARVTPQRWSVNFGGFTIQINGDLRPIDTSSFRKGMIAELFMSRNRQQPERIAIGQLRSLTGGRGVWRLEFGDFISAMTTRLSTKADQLSFYYNAGTETTVSTNFNFHSSANLYLADITTFEKDLNYDGMIFVDNGSGSTSYYTWSSKTTTSAPAGYLTITSTGAWPATANLDVLNSGSKVTSLARLQARADYIFARTVMSTGNATQGWADDYPKSWGSGINWNPDIIDKINMDQWYLAWKTASGTHECQLVIEKTQDSGIRHLLNSFLQIGMWPVFRQGRISWRVCQDPEKASTNLPITAIRETDIIAIESHAIYSPSQPVVYSNSTVVYSSSAGAKSKYTLNVSNVKALPANNTIERDNSLIYRIDSPVQSSKATVDGSRMSAWDLYTYEELTLAVQERFAGLVAGDIVAITSSMIYGFNDPVGKTYQSKRGMVLGNRWLPNQSRCILTVGIIGK